MASYIPDKYITQEKTISDFFIQAFVYLVAAVVAVPLAKRLGLGSALGYLLAGVLIGPFVLGLVGEEGEDVLHFAEFGVVMMLFIVGLEMKPALLWHMRVSILGLGGAQILVTASVIAAAAWYFGLTWQVAVAIGMTLSLSSTAMVLQTLDEKGWMKTQAGKAGFSVLLAQDIAVIPMLALLPFLALSGATTVAADGTGTDWIKAVTSLGVIAGMILAGLFLTRPLFRWIADTNSSEVFVATALVLVIGSALLVNSVGLSPALGTFIAGVVLADSEYRHELEADIEPFKGLLLGLFFISVGANIDFDLVMQSPWLIAGLVLLLIAIKFPVLLLLGRIFGLKLADNLMFAFILAQGGEFAFLLFSYAAQTQVMGSTLANLLIVVVALSMIVTPLMIIIYERYVQPRFAEFAVPPEGSEVQDLAHPIIVAGFGRFGQVVARMLRAAGYQTTLLDHDAGQVELSARFGNKVFYGDPSRLDLLRAAGADKAKLLIVTLDDREKAVSLVETARTQFPHLRILARAYDRAHAYKLIAAKADGVTRETFGSALLMGEHALRLLGNSEERAQRVMDMFRRHDEEGLARMFEFWGDDKAYGQATRQHLAVLEKVLQDDVDDEITTIATDKTE
ncbi:MAG TPA: monovalent cation:proton antiporter-2 (CPA2) family protein [Xanthomonadales bacterium]|nr:monovalent cation:proton antiporter-2 (CPA2) family protein [Xanthomonadales bacterium]